MAANQSTGRSARKAGAPYSNNKITRSNFSMRFSRLSALALCLCVFLCHSTAAFALPAFARQTGQECAACHVGSFGPQLTAFGRNFKLNGYTMGGVGDRLKKFSAMVQTDWEHTTKELRSGVELPASSSLNNNDNFSFEQVSLFYGGALTSNIGMFSQATHSGPDDTYSWDNTDIRYANYSQINGKNFVYGVTANNNPTVQDLWNTTPAWQFPFISSGIAPAPAASPFIGSLAQTVGGVGAYTMYDNHIYAELSAYSSLNDKFQETMGMQDVNTTDHLSGMAPYWRLALQQNNGPQYFEIGTFGMAAHRFPGGVTSSGTDAILDYALDATYQFTSGNGRHNISLYASALHENQNLSASVNLGNASNLHDTLNFYKASGSYYYKNTYGITVSPFITTGSTDAMLYAPSPTGEPDSSGVIFQADYTPFGTEKSPAYPYMNVRLFAQYTAYDKFNGQGTNYDGTGRNASDNNTTLIGAWFAF